MRRLILLAGVTALAAAAQSEAPVSFEVASVKPHDVGAGSLRRVSQLEHLVPWSGPLWHRRQPLHGRRSEHQRPYQIAGLPDWGDSGHDLFDVVAKVPGERTPRLGEVRRMLQSLLADRFQLKPHHETRELSVYALVTARGGPKLKRLVQEPGKPLALTCPAGDGVGGSGGGLIPKEEVEFLRLGSECCLFLRAGRAVR